jgi:hypothetical protein
MGINNGSKCLFALKDLSIDHVKEIGKQMARVNGRDNGYPRLFVDASWLERKKSNRCAEVVGVLLNAGFKSL